MREEPLWLHIRREPFEHGLLPLPPLPHANLGALRARLATPQLSAAALAAAMALPDSHAHLVLDTLASVASTDVRSVEELLVFLYVQTYRRVPSRPHRGAADVADVWPSASPIDGFLSPVQARSAVSRRAMPCQAEEELNQLTYVQKHLPHLLTLLADTTTEEEGNSGKVITAEQFNHLGLLLSSGVESLPLHQTTPFFANSDPAMPPAPVPISLALEWILHHIRPASDSLEESASSDVPMAEAQTILVPNGVLHLAKDWRPEGMTFVDGVVRASVAKREGDIKGDSVKVSHCHDSVVYVLAPLNFVSVFGCSDSTIVLGAVGKALRVEHCERVHVIVPTSRITIASCRECVFYLGVNQQPLFTGDNHNLQVAPYNTFYPSLEAHLAQVGVDATVNQWNRPLTLDAQAQAATQLPPEKFVTFVVPRWNETGSEQQLVTRANPFLLPKPYLLAQQLRCKAAESLRQSLKTTMLEDGKKRELMSAIHSHFRDWLFASENIRQIYDLQALERLE